MKRPVRRKSVKKPKVQFASPKLLCFEHELGIVTERKKVSASIEFLL